MDKNGSVVEVFVQMKEFFSLLVDNARLSVVESASLLVAEFLALLVAGLLLFVSLSLMLLAGVWLLSLYVGFPLAAFLVSLKLLLLCAFVYGMRRRLFVDCVVARLCAVLFADDGKGGKGGKDGKDGKERD